jgi:hypothetical protein
MITDAAYNRQCRGSVLCKGTDIFSAVLVACLTMLWVPRNFTQVTEETYENSAVVMAGLRMEI